MTTAALQVYADKGGRRGIDIGKTADLFRRYVFIEQSCVRALAGWFLRHSDWEAKIRLGYFLYAHAEHADAVLGRLEEMRGGNRHVAIDPELNRLGEELVNAPDEASFLAGLSVVLADLETLYREHLAAADASANALEIRLLQRMLPDIERERREIGELLGDNGLQRAEAWTGYVESLLRTAGGIGGFASVVGEATVARPEGALFEWPTPIRFDGRMRHADLGTYESKMSLPLRERAIGEFEVYFNEFYAAALLATIIYDSWKLNMPREYFYDIARHFWDEVRHAEFGAIRLRELGVEPEKVNMVLFENSRHMPLLHRLCYLTLGLEVFFMPRKSERARYYEQQGDARSQLFADVDWSEEINHVNYGKRWVNHLLEDDARTVKDVQEEISAYLERVSAGLSESRKAPW